jgi:hypothetical protein
VERVAHPFAESIASGWRTRSTNESARAATSARRTTWATTLATTLATTSASSASAGRWTTAASAAASDTVVHLLNDFVHDIVEIVLQRHVSKSAGGIQKGCQLLILGLSDIQSVLLHGPEQTQQT